MDAARRGKWIGFLCLGVTAFGWALNWPLMKLLLQQWPPLFARGLAGAVFSRSEFTMAGSNVQYFDEFSGTGLHTGEAVTMRVLPAPAGKGIVFRRVDLDNFELRADVGSVERVAYATTLMNRGVWISTVEHLLSALYGMGIDNAFVELDNFEVPILDGSGLLYVEAIERVGIVALDLPRNYLQITKSFARVTSGRRLFRNLAASENRRIEVWRCTCRSWQPDPPGLLSLFRRHLPGGRFGRGDDDRNGDGGP